MPMYINNNTAMPSWDIILLRYLLNKDEELSTLIMCKPNAKLITTDQSLYEALGALKEKEHLDYSRLVKLIENVEVISYRRAFGLPRRILSFERVEELQSIVGEKNE